MQPSHGPDGGRGISTKTDADIVYLHELEKLARRIAMLRAVLDLTDAEAA
jgi:hypothetical protein